MGGRRRVGGLGGLAALAGLSGLAGLTRLAAGAPRRLLGTGGRRALGRGDRELRPRRTAAAMPLGGEGDPTRQQQTCDEAGDQSHVNVSLLGPWAAVGPVLSLTTRERAPTDGRQGLRPPAGRQALSGSAAPGGR